MAEKASAARSGAAAIDVEELSAELGEVRRALNGEVKQRRDVIKPLEGALKALKDPHRNAVALHEASAALDATPPELTLPANFSKLSRQLRLLADENLSELEFTFARDLREAFKEKGVELSGTPAELIAELFVIKVDMRRKQVEMSFSRQSVTAKKIKLNVEQVVTTYERARREIGERKVDLGKVLEELFEAYSRVLKLTGKPMGTRASIVDCYRELVLVRQPLGFRKNPSKTSFVDYPKAHFAYDMLQLRRGQKMMHAGHRLNLGTATIDVGSDTARAMFLATAATEGQFIKDLYFTVEK
ncbi:MAG: hypothetical protein MSG64_10510 [Pyrinomonadaceae bacterium MAG19_C2-C3]|nr:hypothetical protein [Pyrinomonadaceae bacterium MAG19_C2-C3]